MAIEEYPVKERSTLCFAAFVALAGLGVGLVYHINLWILDADGFSTLTDRLPYWDFSNLWAGSKMAIEGHVAWLFDVDAYRAALRVYFSPALPDQEWSYPPSIILFGAALALLPIHVAYLIWTFGTVAMLHVAIRPLRLPLLLHLAALTSPAVLMNAVFGQNGALTGALLIGGLLLVPKRPILAGVLFGLLTVKPHLGILVPFCLLAGGHWRTVLAAAASAAVLALATGFAFGFEVWRLFLTETGPLMTGIMEAPYPQPYHANALTVFVLARAAGSGLAGAYAAQAVATIVAAVIVIRIWLPGHPMDQRRRALLTATLAIVATPYGYSYDTIPMCVALAFLFAVTQRPRLALMALAWLFPYGVHMLNYHGIGVGILVPLGVAAWLGAGRVWVRQEPGPSGAGTAGAGAAGAMSDRTRTVVAESR